MQREPDCSPFGFSKVQRSRNLDIILDYKKERNLFQVKVRGLLIKHRTVIQNGFYFKISMGAGTSDKT